MQKDKSQVPENMETSSDDAKDQVAKDIVEAKTFLSRLMHKLKEKSAPMVSKGKETSGAAMSSASGLIDKEFLKKLIRIFFIIFFLLILVFIGVRILGLLQTPQRTVQTNGEAPTTAPFSPYRPSIYAEDLEVLALEQEINVLEREISRAILREDSLFPPTLDFNVNFKN